VSVLESDAAVESRFRRITVPRPSSEQVLEIVRAFGPRLEQRHSLRIAPESYACARDSAARYLGHEAPPRSALRLLSAAASHAELRGRATLDRDLVLAEVEEMTGIPTREPGEKERTELRDLEATLSRALHGQPQAIARIARLIRNRRLDPPRQLHPLVILAFGPSGTGKTEIGKLLQRYICDPTLDPILFPMEQTKQDFQITALLGAPPGYVGYDKGGELANRIAGRPHSVVIFDEIEKAHPDVLQGGLMQVLETGSYVDPRGRRGDYRAAIIVCTSNLLAHGEANGAAPAEIRRLVVEAFSRPRDGRVPVPPEFVGRCQVLVPFQALSEQACTEIAGDRIAEIQAALLADFGIRAEAAPGCAQRLAHSRWDPTQNARPIIHATRELEAVAREELELGTAAPTLILDWDATGPVVRPGGSVT
jgi:ATP-dependent Clp protease ATP-binding subunit ClpA